MDLVKLSTLSLVAPVSIYQGFVIKSSFYTPLDEPLRTWQFPWRFGCVFPCEHAVFLFHDAAEMRQRATKKMEFASKLNKVFFKTAAE